MPECLSLPPAALQPDTWPAVTPDALRVGRLVRIDLPWSAHPFAVSEFRIGDADQLAAVRAVDAARVLGAPPPLQAQSDAAAVAPLLLSRHAPRVLAGLAQLWAGTAAAVGADGAADTAPVADASFAAAAAGSRVDSALCRRQLLDAALDVVELDVLPLPPPGAEALPGDAVPAAAERPPTAGAVPAVDRLACALSAKLTGLPSAYIRALCEDAAQADTLPPAFPPALRVAVLALLLSRAVGLAAAGQHAVLRAALLRDAAPTQAPGPVPVPDRPGHRPVTGDGWLDGVCRLAARRDDAAVEREHRPRHWQGRPARIVALILRYDALCRPAPPAAGIAPHLALAWLLADDHTPVDAPLLRAFGRLMGAHPPGSLAQLSDAGYARAVASRRRRPPPTPPLREARPPAGFDAAGIAPAPPQRHLPAAPAAVAGPFAVAFAVAFAPADAPSH